MSEPILTEVSCWNCGHQWNALCPDGLESESLECPKCGKDTGKPMIGEKDE